MDHIGLRDIIQSYGDHIFSGTVRAKVLETNNTEARFAGRKQIRLDANLNKSERTHQPSITGFTNGR